MRKSVRYPVLAGRMWHCGNVDFKWKAGPASDNRVMNSHPTTPALMRERLAQTGKI